MTRAFLWLAARLVPGSRRADWLEHWNAELWALQASGCEAADEARTRSSLRFVLGALPDAWVEARDSWREGWSLGGLSADIRDAGRAAARAPATSLLTIGILGLGTAAAGTIFSLADAIVLRPPPGIHDAGRLVQVGRKDPVNFDTLSYPNYRDLRDGLTGVVELAGWANTSAVVGAGIDADVVPAQAVTANYLRVVGVAVTRGPGFTEPDELRFAKRAELVVSQPFWRDHGASIRSDDGILVVNGQPFRVVGVLPDDFVGVDVGNARPDLWIPMISGLGGGLGGDAEQRFVERGWSWMRLVGRLAPGVSFERARAATEAVHGRLAEQFGPTIGDRVTVVAGVGLDPPGRLIARQLLTVFMSIAGLVVLVAAANVAGLQFSRGLGRRHELAVRLSLGASRARVLRGLLVEQAVLAGLAGVAAFLLTYWSGAWLQAALPYQLAVAVEPSPRVLVFALAVALVASTLLAIWPLRSVTRQTPATVLRGRRADPRARAGRILVGIELAVSAALLSLGVMLVRSVVEAANVDPGFETDRILVATIRRQPAGVMAPDVLVDEIRDRLSAVPGVLAVGLATSVPVIDLQSSTSVHLPGEPVGPDAPRRLAITAEVDPAVFRILGLSPVAGRVFDDTRATDGAVPIVINTVLAETLFSDGDAVGQSLVMGRGRGVVAGVVGPTALRTLRDRGLPAVWSPLDASREMPSRVLIRTQRDPSAVMAGVRAGLEPLGHDVLLRRLDEMTPLVDASIGETLMASRIVTVFAAVSLLMAAVGLYGVASAQVSRRRYEFGVRLALGAHPGLLTRGVLRAALVTAGIGCLVGAAGAWLAAPPLQGFLFNVAVVDPLAMAATTGILAITSVVAAWVPSRRAGRTDPLIVMQAE